ncbi:hypothetical protein Tco_0650189 [Tanacetum coccineum]
MVTSSLSISLPDEKRSFLPIICLEHSNSVLLFIEFFISFIFVLELAFSWLVLAVSLTFSPLLDIYLGLLTRVSLSESDLLELVGSVVTALIFLWVFKDVFFLSVLFTKERSVLRNRWGSYRSLLGALNLNRLSLQDQHAVIAYFNNSLRRVDGDLRTSSEMRLLNVRERSYFLRCVFMTALCRCGLDCLDSVEIVEGIDDLELHSV